MIFTEKLSRIARLCHAKEYHAPKFRREDFTNSQKTVKFANVFSLESFPLYGICTEDYCLLRLALVS